MATKVQSKSLNPVNDADGVVSLSFDSLPSAGSTVIVLFQAYQAGLTLAADAVADNQSNTYTRAASHVQATDYGVAVYHCLSVGSPSGTFTVTLTAGGTGACQGILTILEYTGIDALEGATATGSGLGAPTVTRAVGTASALQVAICGTVANQSSLVVNTLSPAWTEEAEQLSSSYVPGESNSRLSDIGTGNFTAAWTPSSENIWFAAVAVYTATGGGATTVPLRLLRTQQIGLDL
jgi:hypothetical protein